MEEDNDGGTTEQEFKAWVRSVRRGEATLPHLRRKLFHRSKNTSTIIVDASGKWSSSNPNYFTSIQKAIDSIPMHNKNPVYITIYPGIYW